MKQLPFLAAACLAITPANDEVRTRYQLDTEVHVTVETEFSLEIGVLTLVMNGKRRPYSGVEPWPVEGSSKRSFVDRVMGVEDGRRTEVERYFEEILGDLGDLDPDTEQAGVLSDRTIRIFLDEDEDNGALVELADDGESVDERYLAGFGLTFPEERLLPADEVEPGSSWTLDGAQVLRCSGLDVGIDWFEESDGFSLDAASVIAKSIEGEVNVTYVENERDGDETVARFEFTFALRGDAVELTLADFLRVDEDDHSRLASEAIEVTAELEGEGSFWLEVDSGRLLGSKSEATASVEVSMPGQGAPDDTWFELDLELELESERTYVHSPPRKDDDGN